MSWWDQHELAQPEQSNQPAQSGNWWDKHDLEVPAVKDLPEPIRQSQYPQEIYSELKQRPADQAFDDYMELSKADIKTGLQAFKGVSPDQAARVSKIASGYKIPLDLAISNREEFEKDQQAQVLFDQIMGKNEDGSLRYPKLAKAMVNPERLAQSTDSIDALRKLEDLVRSRKDPTVLEKAKNIGGKLTQGIAGIPAGVLKGFEEFTATIAPYGIHQSPFEQNKRINPQEGDIYKLGQSVEDKAQEIAPTDKRLEDSFLYNALPQGAGSMIGFMGGGIASKILKAPSYFFPLVGGALVSGSSAYDEAKKSGADEETATNAFLLNLPVGATEIIPLGKFLDRLGKTSEGLGLKQKLIRAVSEGTEEAIQEVVQTTGSNAVAQQLYDEDREYWDGVVESGGAGGITGFMASILLGALGGKSRSPKQFSKEQVDKTEKAARSVEEAQLKLDHLEAVEKIADEAPLSENNPEVFSELVTEIDGDNKIEVEAEKIAEVFFQSGAPDAKEQLDRFAQDVGLTPEQMDEAIRTGGIVELDQSKLIAKYRKTPVFKLVKEALKGDLDAEKEKFKRVQKQLLDSVSGAFEETPEAIKNIRSQLLQRGDKAEDVDAQLAVFTGMIKSLGRSQSETVQQTLDRIGLEVRVGEDGKVFVERLNRLKDKDLLKKAREIISKSIPDADIDQDLTPAQVEALEKELKETNVRLTADELIQLEREARQYEERQLKGDVAETTISFRDALKKSGGLPSVSALREGNDPLTGDLRQALENKKIPGLVKNNAPALDILRSNLEGLGYRFETPADMLNAVSEWLRTGKDPAFSGFNSPDALFQNEPINENLVAVHNLSIDNLDHALKIGGLAVPSLAIVDARHGFDNFGEITLLANPSLIDPKGDRSTKVFNADAYSPRYPTVKYFLDSKSEKAIQNFIGERLEKIGFPKNFSRYTVTGDIKDKGLAWAMENNESVMLAYLVDTNQKIPEFTGEHQYDDFHEVRKLVRDNENEKPKFLKWIKDSIAKLNLNQTEKIFDGYTYSGKRRYLTHDLDTVVKIMKRSLRDGEGFNYGVPSIRASYAKQFRTLEQIKKSRDKIVSKETMDKLKKEVDDEFIKLSEEALPFRANTNTGFGALDAFSDDLKAMAQGGSKNFEHLRQMYPNREPFEKMRVFLEKLRDMPTEYFEAKLQRAVEIQEFDSAVVPDDTPDDLVKKLEKRGIEVVKYEKKNPESRNNALQQAAKTRKLLFQDKQDPRGAIQPINGKTIIHLFKSSDVSTFLHEASHLWLREVQKLIDAGIADARIAKDYETILEWLGSKDGSLTEKMEEKFADGFETYLAEGKAPSVALVDAFNRFKDWLKQIYKAIKGVKVEINDDIRSVFDRMLAAESEIAEAREYYELNQDLSSLITKDKEKAAKLQAKQEALKEKQVAARTAKQLKAADEARKEAKRKSAELDVDGMPVYRVLNQAKGGKISLAALKSNYGEVVAEEIKQKFPDAIGDGNQTIETLALEHGFASPEDLIEALRKSPAREQAIQNRHEQLMAMKEDEIVSAHSASDVTLTDEELHTNESLAALAEETQVLAEEVGRKQFGNKFRLTAKVYRNAAQEELSKMPVAQALAYYRFASAERRHGRDVVKLLQKGKREQALQSRMKQMLNHALVLESIKLREKVSAIEARYTPRKLDSELKSVEIEYHAPIIELLSRYGLTNRKNKDRYDFNNLKKVDDGIYDFLPEFVRNGEKTVSVIHGGRRLDYRDTLTVPELQLIDEAAQALLTDGRSSLRSIKDAEVKTIEDLVDTILKNVEKLSDKKELDGYLKPIHSVRALNAKTTMMNFLADAMDGYSLLKDDKIGISRKLFNEIPNAESNKESLLREIMSQLDPHMKVLNGFADRMNKLHGKNGLDVAIGFELPKPLTHFSDKKWTAQKMVSVLLNTGSADNKIKLMVGYGWGEKEIQKIASFFNEAELKEIQAIWKTIDKLYPKLSEVYLELYNRRLGKIEAAPVTFTSSDGKEITLEGGYYPLMYDPRLNDKAAAQEEENEMRRQAVHRSPTPNKGMTHGRVEGVRRPVKLDLSVLTTHIDDTVKFITYAKPVKDWNRLIKNPRFKAEFTNKFSKEMYSALSQWVKDMANPDPSIHQHRDFADVTADKLKTVVTFKLLGFNIPSAAANVSGLVLGVERIGIKWQTKGFQAVGFPGIIDVFLGKGELLEETKKLSKVISLRENSILKELGDEIKKLQGKRAKKFGEYAFAAFRAFDRFVTVPFWHGAFQKHLETMADKTKSHEEQLKDAVEYADSLLLDTHQSGMKATQSEFQRAQTGLYRHFNMFQSFFNLIGNNISSRYRASYDNIIGKGDLAKYLFALWLAMMLEQSLKDLLKGKAPDWFNTMILNPAQGFVGWIPGLKEASKTITPGKNGVKFDPLRGVLPAQFSVPVNDLRKAYSDASDGDIGPLIWNISHDVSSAFGLPVHNVVNWLYKLEENLSEQEE